jgi:hypothetical protein
MRISSKLISLLLFIALSAGGWGSVLAAAVCPHAGRAPKPVQAKPHCHADAPAAAMSGMEMPVAAEASPEPPSCNARAPQHNETCAHCLTHNAPVPAPLSLRQKNESKRTADVIAPNSLSTPVAPQPLLALPVLTRQGAPPGTSTRRHILNSIFLI